MAFSTAAVLAAGACVAGVTVSASKAAPKTAERASSGPVSLPAVADTYVIQQSPAVRRGTSATMSAAAWPGWNTEGYVAFEVPRRAKGVRTARLDLTFERLANRPSTLELRSLPTAGWSEQGTTWADRPAAGDVLASARSAEGGTVSFDVSRWVDRPGRYAFAVTNPGQWSAARFHARESGPRGPRLVVSDASDVAMPPAPRPSRPAPTPSPVPSSERPVPKPTAGVPAPAPSDDDRIRKGTLCGASFEPEGGQSVKSALKATDQRYGGMEMTRVFYPGLPAGWPGKLGDDRRTTVVSFKMNPRDVLSGRHDDRMRTWFRDAPGDRDVYWVYYHEPEDNIAKGEFSAADYRAAWRRLRSLADKAGNKRLKATLVLMSWSLEPGSRRDWRDYYPGRGVVQVLGWDAYNLSKTGYQDPAEMYRKIISVSRSERLPFGVAETGSHLMGGDTGAKRAAWLREMTNHLTKNKALWAAYFDLDWHTGDYRLRDAAGIKAWRDFC
ncbi:DNRLRE domain-containing protein [Actinomadura sp. 9N407]